MIIKPFNLTYFLMLLLLFGTIVVIALIFRNKSQKAKDIFICSIAIFNILFFIVYKIILSMDGYNFIIWKELPLHLCNINMFIIPLSILLKNKYLKAFGFYVAPLGAFMAVTFPNLEFINNSIFLGRNIGYYGTHCIIIIMGISLMTLGYIKPKYKDIINLLIITAILATFAFVVNLILGAISGVEVNYFYTMNSEGISLLDLFYKLIPIKFFYLLPAVVILIIYVMILNLIFILLKKIKWSKK